MSGKMNKNSTKKFRFIDYLFIFFLLIITVIFLDMFRRSLFFTLKQNSLDTNNSIVSFSQWQAIESPSIDYTQEIPAEIIPEQLIHTEPPPPPPPPAPAATPAPTAPAPVTLLAAPANIRPVRGTNIDINDLQSNIPIIFSWSSVQGANAYIFTLNQQTSDGRQLLYRTTINNDTQFTFDNLRMLDRGIFTWQIEAVRMGRGNIIERRGRVVETTFTIDFPYPGRVYIEDTGVLYGN